MLSFLLLRVALALTPFLVWRIWVGLARRRGVGGGATPWAWLYACAAFLVGLSLMAPVLFREDNLGKTYVPAEVGSGGRIEPGHFEGGQAPR